MFCSTLWRLYNKNDIGNKQNGSLRKSNLFIVNIIYANMQMTWINKYSMSKICWPHLTLLFDTNIENVCLKLIEIWQVKSFMVHSLKHVYFWNGYHGNQAVNIWKNGLFFSQPPVSCVGHTYTSTKYGCVLFYHGEVFTPKTGSRPQCCYSISCLSIRPCT